MVMMCFCLEVNSWLERAEFAAGASTHDIRQNRTDDKSFMNLGEQFYRLFPKNSASFPTA